MTRLLIVALMLFAQEWSGRVPATIEVLRDVESKTSERRADGTYGQERGYLYATDDFTIKKGQRFVMLQELGEGGCRIRFQNKEHVIASCPWLGGFADHQEDIFKVVAPLRPSNKRQK